MKNWLNQVIQICVEDMPYEQKKEWMCLKQKEYEAFDEKTQHMIRQVIGGGFDTRDSVYVLSVFFHCLKDRNWMEELVRNVLKVENYSWIESIMLECQFKRWGIGTFQEKKQLREKTIKKISSKINIDYDYLPVEKRNKKRILILTEQMLSIYHSPTLMLLNYAYTLREMGYEVKIFACPCDVELDVSTWYGAYNSNVLVGLEEQIAYIEFREKLFEFYQIKLSASNCVERYQLLIELIKEWKPLFVYESGLINPIGDVFKHMTTVVSETLGANECAISNGQILLRLQRADDAYEEQVEKTLNTDQQQLWIKDKFPVHFENDNTRITRKELGLPEDKFLIAIVGNRLDGECENEFCDLIQKILQDNLSAAVVMVGEVFKLKETFAGQERVYFIGYQKSLSKVYDVMDLYLNPNREGGGYSSLMALQSELPVVTLPDGDVAYNVGEEFIVADYHAMYEMVGRHIADKEFHEKKKQKARELYEQNTDTKAVEYFENLLRDIEEMIRKSEDEI